MNKEIDQVFWPTWLAVSQLRDGAEVDDGAVLYRRASQWVESAREALRDMGYSEHSVEHMLYRH
ncbi:MULTISPECIES: DotU family type IV/VI secretion system protein [Citrobacter]|uniref:DotU family type IV/VI secretion system protein n=1 Tax=Citrobacter TaxID=544 RepID=UPI001F0A097A|nr:MULTISPECIES: DotU family type IV/VI secretion system protein [Citrobacter]MCQ6312281.1 DotU family type IV/VI secretion system protein [Citrobacter portucalensis]MDM2794356.1 DotU family type IV/VI secretion system protein [Citrobacter sp. Cpo114]